MMSVISCTRAVLVGIVFASFRLAACSIAEQRDASLTERWRNEITEPRTVDPADRGATDSERFYVWRRVNGQRVLAAYNRTDGTIAWRGRTQSVCDPPVVFGERVFCPAANLYAFDAATGRSLWTLQTDSTLEFSTGTADANRVFAGSLSSAYAVDATTGTLLWKRSFSGQDWLSTSITSFTLTDGGDLLVALEANFTVNAARTAAVIIAVDPATGRERWRFQDGDAPTFRKVGSLTVWNDLILYSDPTGGEFGAQTVAVDLATRQVRWRRELGATFIGTRRAPTVVDGIAYWASGDQKIYAADAATGEPRWTSETGRGSYFNHDVCGPVVVANNFELTVADRATGASRGGLFSGELVGQTATADGELYVATERGVYAFACE